MSVCSEFHLQSCVFLESESESDRDEVRHIDHSTADNENGKYFTLFLKYWFHPDEQQEKKSPRNFCSISKEKEPKMDVVKVNPKGDYLTPETMGVSN